MVFFSPGGVGLRVYARVMRIWSLHPSQLDRQGLLACWRETLLAQAVLLGKTRGYTNHPQLQRFREQPDPQAAIAAYLSFLHDDATARGYNFDRARIVTVPGAGEVPRLLVTEGQVNYEWQHLLAKLAHRNPELHARLIAEQPILHPLFSQVPGPVEPWERI